MAGAIDRVLIARLTYMMSSFPLRRTPRAAFVVQMFYSTLKESNQLVAETKNTVSNLSKKEFILMGFGEHTSAIAFVSSEPEANITAQFGRIRGEKFSLVAFEVAWLLGGNMSKDVSDWLDRHKPSPFKTANGKSTA